MATRADERPLYDLLVEMWGHNGNGWGYSFDPTLVIARIEAGTRPDPRQRSNPNDQLRGVIGVIDSPRGLIGTIGLFSEPGMWFSQEHALYEIWLYVKPKERRPEHTQALRDFALWVHEKLKPAGSPYPYPLATGFVHVGSRFPTMQKVWQRLWPRARQVGCLYWIE